MKKAFSFFSFVLICLFIFSSCSNRGRSGPTLSVTDPVSVTQTTQSTESTTQQVSEQTVSQTTTVPADTVPTEPVTTNAGQTDDKMVFSSDPENIFISAVVAKYGVDASNLVAFYVSSEKSNANLVYEFDGTVGSDGRAVRSKKTLKNIYTVSAPPELLAKKASGTAAEGNEYDEKDTKLCQYFTDNVLFRFFAKDIQNA